MAGTACTNLTEAARSVQLFKINSFTATKERPIIASRIWTVGGHDWQIDYHANGCDDYQNDGWIKFRLSLVSAASGVAASFSCRLVHPESSSNRDRPSQEKMASSVFRQNSFVDVDLMKRHDLESSGYVKDESFLVQCAINVLLVGDRKDAAAVDTVTEPCSDLQKDLGELLRSQKGADIRFLVSGESIAAHRCVLAARSPVFKAEISGEMKEKVLQCVEIKDMEAKVFKAMLHFIYTDTLPELDNRNKGEDATAMARLLLEAADRYGLQRLKGVCAEKVCTSIGVESVATALALAEQHGCSNLKAKCMKFILSHVAHFQDIAATEGYKHLEETCPSVLTDLLKLMVRQGHK